MTNSVLSIFFVLCSALATCCALYTVSWKSRIVWVFMAFAVIHGMIAVWYLS